MLEAIVAKHVSKAASGDPKSTALVFDAFRAFEGDQDNHIPQLLQQFRAIHASHVAEDEPRPLPPSTDPPDKDE